MNQEKSFCVCVIVHPAFLQVLEKHLKSLQEAQNNYNSIVCIKVLFSYCKNEIDENKFKSIISKYDDLSLEYFIENERYTCGRARNYLFEKTKTEWCIFFDSDVIVDKNYFITLSQYLSNLPNEHNLRALAGGMGTWGTTSWGFYEYLMDMYAYYGKIEGFDPKKEDLRMYVSTFENKSTHCSKLNDKRIYYLQGYNHIIHRDMYLLHNGYDSLYFGAEDREMSGRIYSLGYNINIVTDAMVYHFFNFSLHDIIRRKYGHGYYSAKFRDKYRYLNTIKYERGFSKWFKYFITLFIVPKTFRSVRGYIYHLIAFGCYFSGSVVYNFEKHFRIRIFGIHDMTDTSQKKYLFSLVDKVSGFNYSKYSYTNEDER